MARGTHLAGEHPEWVISLPGQGDGLLNLGIPEAREYLTKYLIAAIQQYQLAWLRIDYNIDPLAYWRCRWTGKKIPNRVGMAEIRYVEGHYRMWDEIRAAYPQLAIDNCASGGRRIDLQPPPARSPCGAATAPAIWMRASPGRYCWPRSRTE